MTACRVVLVGGAGYLGTSLIARLAVIPGCQTEIVSRDGTVLAGRPTVPFHRLPSLLASDPCSVVWLLAGERHDEHRRLGEFVACLPADTSVRLVYASSCAVYGRSDDRCTEDTLPNPLDHYAGTKLACERLLAAAPCSVCVLRIATLHDATAAEPRQSVHRLLQQAKAGRVSLYAPNLWRSFISLEDATTAVCRAIQSTRLTGTYNLAHDDATFGMVAGFAAGLFRAELVVRDEPVDHRSYRIDASRARAAGLLDRGPIESLWMSMSRYADGVRRA